MLRCHLSTIKRLWPNWRNKDNSEYERYYILSTIKRLWPNWREVYDGEENVADLTCPQSKDCGPIEGETDLKRIFVSLKLSTIKRLWPNWRRQFAFHLSHLLFLLSTIKRLWPNWRWVGLINDTSHYVTVHNQKIVAQLKARSDPSGRSDGVGCPQSKDCGPIEGQKITGSVKLAVPPVHNQKIVAQLKVLWKWFKSHYKVLLSTIKRLWPNWRPVWAVSVSTWAASCPQSKDCGPIEGEDQQETENGYGMLSTIKRLWPNWRCTRPTGMERMRVLSTIKRLWPNWRRFSLIELFYRFASVHNQKIVAQLKEDRIDAEDDNEYLLSTIKRLWPNWRTWMIEMKESYGNLSTIKRLWPNWRVVSHAKEQHFLEAVHNQKIVAQLKGEKNSKSNDLT